MVKIDVISATERALRKVPANEWLGILKMTGYRPKSEVSGEPKRWHVDYRVGNTYKTKYVVAKDNKTAVRRARVKNIVDLFPVSENGDRIE